MRRSRQLVVCLSDNALVLINVSCSTSGPVSTRIGKHLWVAKPSQYVTIHPGQLSLAIPQRVAYQAIH